MSTQLHKNFTDDQVKSLLKSYLDKEIKINYILQMLSIKRSRFFELLSRYRKDPGNFSIQYSRKTTNRKIDSDIERNIVKELRKKDDPPLAIGENYIKKIFLFFNILFMDVFTYCLTIRNPRDVVTEKGDKKFLLLFLSIIFFISLLRGED